MEPKKIKICVGLLSNRGFKGKTVLSLLKMIASNDFDYHFALIETGYTIAENRNFLAVQAIKNNCDYLLMVDDDMIFPPETLGLLVSRDKDIIGVPYNCKVAPKPGEGERKRHNITYFPVNELTPEDTTDGPVEVMAIGAGVMLVKVDVFKKLTQPYFDFESYENGMTRVGEDNFFCYKATKEGGYKIWCEKKLDGLFHIGDYLY